MGYTIRYENKGDKIISRSSNKRFRYTWLIVLSGIILMSIALTKSTDPETIKEWLIPGNPMVTKAAFSLMIDELREGESFTDAVTTFCNEIIAGGKTQTVFNT